MAIARTAGELDFGETAFPRAASPARRASAEARPSLAAASQERREGWRYYAAHGCRDFRVTWHAFTQQPARPASVEKSARSDVCIVPGGHLHCAAGGWPKAMFTVNSLHGWPDRQLWTSIAHARRACAANDQAFSAVAPSSNGVGPSLRIPADGAGRSDSYRPMAVRCPLVMGRSDIFFEVAAACARSCNSARSANYSAKAIHVKARRREARPFTGSEATSYVATAMSGDIFGRSASSAARTRRGWQC
mgnify:CR=1 FL=1